VKRLGDDGRVLANAAAFFSQRGGDELAAKPVQPIHVPGAITKASLISKVEPVYPPLAKQARIQGTVRFAAIIGEDGHIEKLQVISGHPLLIRAAQEAVRQYVYKPVLLNGRPVEVMTDIDVLFTLGPTSRETPERQQTGPRTP